MTTLSAANPTLLDLASRQLPDGSIDRQIVEMLAQQNDIVADGAAVECNDGSGHKTTVRTGIPEGTWRRLYQGVPESKSTTAPVRDTTGSHENYATIDAALAEQAGGSASWRLSEEAPFIEGMNQGIAKTMFYGDTSIDKEKFEGIVPRFNDTTAQNGENIVKGGAAGGNTDNTSIYLVGWHPTTVHLLFPKNGKFGLQMKDLGEQTVYDASGNPFQALRTHYKWQMGLCVRDWRAIVRIPNIDVSALTKNASTGDDLIDLITQAVEIPPAWMSRLCRWKLYANRTVRSFLRRQVANKVAASTLTMETVSGKPVMVFDDIPFGRCDQITNTEALVA